MLNKSLKKCQNTNIYIIVTVSSGIFGSRYLCQDRNFFKNAMAHLNIEGGAVI